MMMTWLYPLIQKRNAGGTVTVLIGMPSFGEGLPELGWNSGKNSGGLPGIEEKKRV